MLQQAAIRPDDYSLTYRSSFGRCTAYEEKGKKPTGPNVDGGPLDLM